MEHWYCVDKEGLATLCANKEDAELTVKECDLLWPKNGPHRVGRVFDETVMRKPVAWMYQCTADNSKPVLLRHRTDWAESGTGLWIETPLYATPPAQPAMRKVGVVEPLMGTMRTVIWDEGMIPLAGTTLWAKDE